MNLDDLDLTPALRDGIAAAERVFGLTPKQVLIFALQAFLQDHGLLEQQERPLPPQRETRGLAEKVFAREPNR